MSSRLIGLAGGIGSGKSVVSRICRLNGVEVYDCDLRAKEIMASSDEIKSLLQELTQGCALLPDGSIDRKAVACAIFNDAENLARLNRMVHAKVRNDVDRWRKECSGDICLVESAILASSGLAEMCDEVWEVTAPEELRISRVKSRNPELDADAIKSRIHAQHQESSLLEKYNHKVIANDGNHSLLKQILSLI